jgi:hypothetical protein
MGDALAAVSLGTSREALDVAVGGYHACALLDDGTVKCWGIGSILGLGDTEFRGDEPGEMGDNLPAVDLGTGRRATSISAGGALTCATLDDGSLRCWGQNTYGQLGLGDTASRGHLPGQMGDDLPAVELGSSRRVVGADPMGASACALLDDRAVKCWGGGGLGLGDTESRGDEPGEMGDDLPGVELGF